MVTYHFASLWCSNLTIESNYIKRFVGRHVLITCTILSSFARSEHLNQDGAYYCMLNWIIRYRSQWPWSHCRWFSHNGWIQFISSIHHIVDLYLSILVYGIVSYYKSSSKHVSYLHKSNTTAFNIISNTATLLQGVALYVYVIYSWAHSSCLQFQEVTEMR